jgi:hypothetical protein
MRKSSETGEVEIEVPGTLLALDTVDQGPGADPELRRRVAEAVSRVHRPRPSGRERALTKFAMALKQTWWRFSR